MSPLAVTARAFALARWRMARLRSRAAIERFQRRKLAALGRHLATLPFYRGIDPDDSTTWPIVDKAVLLANFAAMNVAGLPLAAVRGALATGEPRIGDLVVGHSTGTSGNRGYFIIADAERYVWLGTLLARALPDALWRRHRVALALPGFSRLYAAAGGGSRVQLGLFDLADGIDAWERRFADFAADTVVAPPKVLRLLAERGRLPPGTVAFAAAEVLDPPDAAIVAAATGRPLRQIYMATEGLFGVSCPRGTLHLVEDAVRFEWEPAAGSGDLVQPVVTDFTRRAQALARYRMNDLLRLDLARCGCGSAFQAVAAVEGRRDDIFWLPGIGGAARAVTPDILRQAVLDADRRITDFRVTQSGPDRIVVAVPDGVETAPVERSLRAALARLGVSAAIEIVHGIPPAGAGKLRRVRRDWQPDQSSISTS